MVSQFWKYIWFFKIAIIFFPGVRQVATAEIYQWKDKKGLSHFSDVKHHQAKLIKINPGHSYFQVKKVFDGDTLLLENNTKVRLLGINTPELERRNIPSESGALEAKRWLEMALLGKKIRLQKDIEKQDKYGRTLAHVFTQTGRHINLELVKKGLATISIYPPNLQYTDQLLEAQNLAEAENKGLWADQQYQPKPIPSLDLKNSGGWLRLIGTVIAIRDSRKYVYLEFSNSFDTRISRKNLSYFPNLSAYLNKNVEVRGWLPKRKKHQSLLLRHPSAIKFLE